MLKFSLRESSNFARNLMFSSSLILLSACGGKLNGSSSSVAISSSSATSSVTQSSSSVSIPNNFSLVIQSEDFDRFQDTTTWQEGTCGTGAVDMGPAIEGQPGTCDIGWTNAGEWLEYDVEIGQAGTYDLGLGLGSAMTNRTVTVMVNGETAGDLAVPAKGWTEFESVSLEGVTLTAGVNVIRVLFTTGATNFDSMLVTSANGQVQKPGVLLALRAGQNSYLDSDGVFFSPDASYANGGSVQTYAQSVANTQDDALYQTQRLGAFAYELPLAGGTYDITVKTAEMVWTSTGMRRFDISIEGQNYFKDVDLYDMAAAKTAVDLVASGIEVNDGALSLEFMATIDQATLAAILVTEASSQSSSSSSSSSVALSSSSIMSSSSVISSSSSVVVSSSSIISSSSSSSAAPADSDKDGVADNLDLCPGTLVSESVDANGCSSSQKDTDNDGVNDALDQCPLTATGASVDAQGCSANQLDSDNDSVNNAVDLCPATPAGEAVDANGCSTSQTDGDNDGVKDSVDVCPATPTGETADATGCSASQKDTDKDGINDALDQCPNTPANATVNSQGCGPTETDGDNDGVSNAADLCPATPAGQTVDANGCSSSQKDTDNDGVKDNVDACPSTPAGQAADANGCSSSQKDTDNDGVKDNVDACPSTPAGQSVDGTGCSSSQKDTDNDGVKDNVDACPSTPAGQAADANGCSSSQKDTDNDGVKDNVDACPSTPAGQTADANGCSSSQKDTDNDGVKDNVDACPSTPAGQAADANGCSSSQKDTDNDGVKDNVDACPSTPAGAKITTNGCSANQLTGNVSQGQATWATSCAGCHGNYINDGLAATMNIDPNSLKKTTNANLAAYIEANMPLSGPATCEGQCAANTAAFVRTLTAKPDSDNDGVFDSVDICPATPAGQSVDVEGCSASQIDAETLYGLTCSGCHGAEGQGVGSFPVIYGANATILRSAIANGTLMPGVGANLSEQEIDALGKFISELPAPALDGAAVYAEKGCAGCHSANGSGGAGPDIRGKTAANLTAILSSGPTMSAAFIAGNLNAEEIQAIGDYLSTL